MGMQISDLSEGARQGNGVRLHGETTRLHGDALAIEHHGERQTYAEVHEQTARIAGGFRDLGLESDDVLEARHEAGDTKETA